jgi:hypothetical protein
MRVWKFEEDGEEDGYDTPHRGSSHSAGLTPSPWWVESA